MEVAVQDTGIGIREEEKDKLFSAFDRLDLEKNRSIEGSGLGLTISQRLLSLMGSEIHVKSEYGKGSCFSFTITQGISDGTPIGPFDAEKAIPHGNRKRALASFTAPDASLLVVDDTPMNLQVICGLLKGNGMMIDTAESGAECLSLFRENTYDLVFLDQRMPNMDGVETLRELKKQYPEKIKKTPVVCLTANVLSGAREQMLKAGFDDYLTKPVNLANMEQILLKYLPKEKILSPLNTPSDPPRIHSRRSRTAFPKPSKSWRLWIQKAEWNTVAMWRIILTPWRFSARPWRKKPKKWRSSSLLRI